MNSSPVMKSFTSNEPFYWTSLDIINNQVAVEKFNQLNRQARWVSLWNRLTGHPHTLLPYEQMRSQSKGVTSLDLGIQEIPVKSIVGSLYRAVDYDRQFRPLNPELKSRWINVYMTAEHSGWEPIIVHKIGDQYFVEDGHHRVSVARHSGWDTIEAHVFG